jgi:hypothetical protein
MALPLARGALPRGRCVVLVAEGDFDGAGVFYQLAAGIDTAHFVDGIGDGDGAGRVVFVAHHESEFSLFEELNSFDTEAGSEDAVEHGGCASALEVAEDAGANFLSCAIADFAPDDFRNASEAAFSDCRLEPGNSSILWLRSFGDDDHRAFGAFFFPAQDLGGHFGKFKGNFWNENDVCTTCESAVQGDPAGVAPHDFDHHDAFVARGCGMEAVEGAGNAFDSGVEAECHIGGLKVVIDGFWNSDDWQPCVV